MAQEGMHDASELVTHEALAQVVAQNEAKLQEAANAFAALETKYEDLHKRMEQATVTPPKSTARPHPPPPFRGAGALLSLPGWISSMRVYLMAAGEPTERWIALACTYLTGSAASWYKHREEAMRQHGITDSWDAFIRDLMTYFQPIDVHTLARDKLYNLRQIHSVQNYNSTFMDLIANIIDMTEDEKVDKYIRGLQPAIQHLVMIENCTTLTTAMQVACKSELIQQRAALSVHQFNNRPTFNRPMNASQGFSRFANNGPTPMEVNNISYQQFPGRRTNPGNVNFGPAVHPAYSYYQNPYGGAHNSGNFPHYNNYNNGSGNCYGNPNHFNPNRNNNVNTTTTTTNNSNRSSNSSWRPSGNGQPRRQ